MCEYASCLAFFLHLSLQCILWNKAFLVWKLYWSCSVFEMIICSTRFLSAKFGHSDYIILTFKAEFVCPACSDFITSSYFNAPEALKLHTNGFSLYYYDIHCVHCYKRPHLTWPQFWCYTAHTWIKTIYWWWKVTWNIPLSNGKTENSLLGVWFWGSVSHFRSQPFVTGSYAFMNTPTDEVASSGDLTGVTFPTQKSMSYTTPTRWNP